MNTTLDAKKKFLNLLMISLGASAIIGIMAVMFGSFGALKSKIILSTLVIGGFSLMGLCSAALYDKKSFVNFAVAGFVVYALGFLFTIAYIWGLFDYTAGAWKSLGVLIVLSVAIAHSSLLLLIKSENVRVRQFLTATLGFVAVVAVMLVGMILLGFNVSEFWFRILGVFAILAILGSAMTPLIRKSLELKK